MKMNLSTLALFTACATSLLAQDAQVRAVGTVQSTRSTRIRAQMPGKTTVLWVVEDGTAVRKGDQLLRLDKAPLEEQLAVLLVNKYTSTAAHAKAEAEYSIERLKAKGAEYNVMETERELAKYEHFAKMGQLELDVKQAESEIKIAEARIAAAVAEANAWRKEHGDDKELRPAITLALAESQELLQLATRKRDHLDKSLRVRLTAAQKLKEKQLEFEQTKERNQLQKRLEFAKANLNAAAEIQQLARTRLDRAIKSLSKAEIRAPVDGLIIHANRPDRTRTGGFILQEGAEVREGQVLLLIPDLDKLQVVSRVSAKQRGLLKIGQPAQVTVDALPNQRFEGVVKFISLTPEPRLLAGDGEFYKVFVDLKPPHQRVLVGMTASIVINTDDKPDKGQKRR